MMFGCELQVLTSAVLDFLLHAKSLQYWFIIIIVIILWLVKV